MADQCTSEWIAEECVMLTVGEFRCRAQPPVLAHITRRGCAVVIKNFRKMVQLGGIEPPTS